ncbi:hypothetical protein HPP92_008198 [Vanilla planifolia]|uniref:K Homology domain-containing protein n=1 Tax=Vanilla planifolia TaxID=51239 RepID=A0A835RNV5_VANPL|nr:hypothetical protein HPP92_008198 [Vanilla planifolia]
MGYHPFASASPSSLLLTGSISEDSGPRLPACCCCGTLLSRSHQIMDYERPLVFTDHRSQNSRKRGTSELDNGRHKRPSTNEGRSVVDTKTIDTIYRILCPIKKIGSVLGKGGDIVSALREETHAKIRVADAIPGADERVIIVFSYRTDIANKNTSTQNTESVNTFGSDDQQMKPHCPAQDALLKIHDRIAADEYVRGGVVRENTEPNDVVTARILVPNNQVGCLLGKGGSVIQKLRGDTNANIRILSAEHLPPCAMSSDELVQISGKPNIVRRALYEISTHLHNHPRKDNPSLEDIISASIQDRYQSISAMPPPVAHGNPVFSRYTPPPTWYDGYRNEPYGHAPSSFNGAHFRDHACTLEDFSIKILCPTDKIGGIIGKGGGNVRQLERQTGATIHVEGTDPDDVDRVIVVSSKEAPSSSVSPTIEAVLRLQRKASEISEKGTINTRLLVSSGKIGCLLGQGGNDDELEQVYSPISDQMRYKIGIRNIVILETMMISGNESVAETALLEIASRLRARSLQGGPVPVNPLHGGRSHGFSPPEGLSVRGRQSTSFGARNTDSYDHPKAYDYPKGNDYPKYPDYPKGYDQPNAYEYPKGFDYPKNYDYQEAYDYSKGYDDYAARYDHTKSHQKIYDYPRSSDYLKGYDYPKDADQPYNSQSYPGSLRPTGYSSMSNPVEVNAANSSVPVVGGSNVSDAHQVPTNTSWRYMDRSGR